MTNLLWVLLPLLCAALVCLAVVVRNRRPKSIEHGIEEFSRELRALAPPGQRRPEDRGGGAG